MADRQRAGICGVGLGLRREFLRERRDDTLPVPVNFLELAPENWIHLGGTLARSLRTLTERYPVACHGLSLSLGGPQPLDERLLLRIKTFMAAHGASLYTEHLSYCGGAGQLYELLPLPFTSEAVAHVAQRIRRTQDILGERIAIENASYYASMPISEMSELAFTLAVLAEADCLLHLDVNNVYVNGVNHGGDPRAFIAALPSQRIAYLHVAGHDQLQEHLIIDSHGAPVIDPVWDLLDYTYATHGVIPTTLERDLRIPPLVELAGELARISACQGRYEKPSPRSYGAACNTA